jgi:hypothetical protein
VQPVGRGRLDHEHQVVGRGQPALDEQRDVVHQHRRAAALGLLGQLAGPLPDPRVDDRVQPPPRVVVAEDGGPERRAVEGAVGLHDAGAEGGDDLLEAGRARLDDLARHLVGVDHGGAAGGQGPGRRRLAGPDAARQPHPQHPARLAAGGCRTQVRRL